MGVHTSTKKINNLHLGPELYSEQAFYDKPCHCRESEYVTMMYTSPAAIISISVAGDSRYLQYQYPYHVLRQ